MREHGRDRTTENGMDRRKFLGSGLATATLGVVGLPVATGATVEGVGQSIPKESPLSRDRWVRIMCEYFCDGVWAKDNSPCHASDLPVSVELVDRIRAWQRLYDSKHSSLSVKVWLRWRRSMDEGLAIAVAVKAELPDWTVVYFDESAMEDALATSVRPRALFEYEIHDTDTEAKRLATAITQAGLVAGKICVREENVEGVFVEAIRIYEGRLWVQVRADERVVANGRVYGYSRKFYGDWTKVSA